MLKKNDLKKFSRKNKTELLWREVDVETERKELSKRGNGGETLITKHVLYCFPLSSRPRSVCQPS